MKKPIKKNTFYVFLILLVIGCKANEKAIVHVTKNVITPVVILGKTLQKVVTEDSLVSKEKSFLIHNMIVDINMHSSKEWLSIDTVFIADSMIVCKNGLKGSDKWYLAGILDTAYLGVKYDLTKWNGDTVNVQVGESITREKRYKWMNGSLQNIGE